MSCKNLSSCFVVLGCVAASISCSGATLAPAVEQTEASAKAGGAGFIHEPDEYKCSGNNTVITIKWKLSKECLEKPVPTLNVPPSARRAQPASYENKTFGEIADTEFRIAIAIESLATDPLQIFESATVQDGLTESAIVYQFQDAKATRGNCESLLNSARALRSPLKEALNDLLRLNDDLCKEEC